MMKEFEEIKKTLNDLQYASKIPSLDVELEEVEKHLKALEIINEKNVNVPLCKESIDVKAYNNFFAEKWHLTKEEFALLEYVLRRY